MNQDKAENEDLQEMEQTEQKTEKSVEDLELQLRVEKRRSEEYLTRLKYIQADLENFRKRCDKQIQEVRDYGNEKLILELLDVVDELELAVKTAIIADSSPALVEGVQMTLKRLRKILEQEGVSPIESENKPFDPTKHNAVVAEECEKVNSCIVLEELRKGYIMKGKVIRPSMVKVSVEKTSK